MWVIEVTLVHNRKKQWNFWSEGEDRSELLRKLAELTELLFQNYFILDFFLHANLNVNYFAAILHVLRF